MYCSAGLSLSQYQSDYENLHSPESDKGASFDGLYPDQGHKTVMLGGILENRLRRIHPIFNVRYDYLARAKAYFRTKKTQSA
jgi:prenyltransferase beta subunit